MKRIYINKLELFSDAKQVLDTILKYSDIKAYIQDENVVIEDIIIPTELPMTLYSTFYTNPLLYNNQFKINIGKKNSATLFINKKTYTLIF